MRPITAVSGLITLSLISTAALAQPPGITFDMINTTLPLEGAPLAVPGSYEVIGESAAGAPEYLVFRPTTRTGETLPLMIWGNGGCAFEGSRAGDFLSTIASHGFLVMTTTTPPDMETRQQTVDDLLGAINWAEGENSRPGSPLNGRIDTDHVAVMGQSCGGMLSVGAGTDPRVDTIGVFNSGVQAPVPNAQGPVRATTDDLAQVHGPVLYINGHEVDFMMEASHANFEQTNHVPTFYGARHNAGHTATLYHPGGGEYANVASNWLLYQFRDDRRAAGMFVGNNCSLCRNSNWDTDSKNLE